MSLSRRTVISAAALSPGLALGLSGQAAAQPLGTTVRDVVLAVHGGTGPVVRGSITPAQEQAYRDALTRALRAGGAALDDGRRALDAVELAVRVLEDDPNFNAGKGAVFNTDAEHELDAAIMDGRDRRSGAVAGVHNTKNPVSLARMVMERTRHVLLAGKGADIFALQNGVAYTTQDHFFTQRRWDALLNAKNPPPPPTGQEHGTVGAVALDHDRDLAAATSTGGLTNKLVGRVGDSPVVGAGTYADSRVVAVSCTGTGEVFIRAVVAHDIAAMMEYGHAQVADAAAAVVTEKIPAMGATGGVIALDRHGALATPHSSAGLVNAYLLRDGSIVTRVYNDETPTR